MRLILTFCSGNYSGFVERVDETYWTLLGVENLIKFIESHTFSYDTDSYLDTF